MGHLGAKPTNWKRFKFPASSSRQLGEEQRCHMEWFIPTFYIKCLLWRRQPGLPHLLTAILCAQLSSYRSGSLEGGEAAVTAQELRWSDLFMVVDVLLGPCYFYVLWQPISGNGWWSTVPFTLSAPYLPTPPTSYYVISLLLLYSPKSAAGSRMTHFPCLILAQDSREGCTWRCQEELEPCSDTGESPWFLVIMFIFRKHEWEIQWVLTSGSLRQSSCLPQLLVDNYSSVTWDPKLCSSLKGTHTRKIERYQGIV